jgi:hypothetical protein
VNNKRLVPVVHSATKEITNPPFDPQAIANVQLAIILAIKRPLVVVGLPNNKVPLVALVLEEQAAEASIFVEVVWVGLVLL